MKNCKTIFSSSNKCLIYLMIVCGIFLISPSTSGSGADASKIGKLESAIRLVRAATGACPNANKKIKRMSKICSGICQDDGDYCKVGEGLIQGPGKQLSCQCQSGGEEDITTNESFSCEASAPKAKNKQKKKVSNFCRKTCKTLEPEACEPYTCKSSGGGKKAKFYCVCVPPSSDSYSDEDSTTDSGGDDYQPCIFGIEPSCFETGPDSNSGSDPSLSSGSGSDTDTDSGSGSGGDEDLPCIFGIEPSCFDTDSGSTDDSSTTSDPTFDVDIPTDSSDSSEIMPTVAPAPILPPGSAGTENQKPGIQLSQGAGGALQAAKIPIPNSG